MKIVIFGGEGFLGTKLEKMFSEKNYEVFSIGNKKDSKYKIDATNYSQILTFLKLKKPEIVIDTIALTNSMECEKNPELAKKLNFNTARNISDACKIVGSKMFFLSSSYVFDGKKGNYNEDNFPSPVGIYGKTKLLAEKELLKERKNIIFRVDLLYGYNGKDISNGIFDKVLSGEKIYIGNPNQIRSPLFIEDIPKIIEKLYSWNESGIFHLKGLNNIRMKEFIGGLENLIRKDSKISILEEKNLLVKPMKDTSLNISKINKLGIKTTGLEEGLKIIKEHLK